MLIIIDYQAELDIQDFSAPCCKPLTEGMTEEVTLLPFP